MTVRTEQCSLLCGGIFSVYAVYVREGLRYSVKRLLYFSYGMTFCLKEPLPKIRKEEKIHLLLSLCVWHLFLCPPEAPRDIVVLGFALFSFHGGQHDGPLQALVLETVVLR